MPRYSRIVGVAAAVIVLVASSLAAQVPEGADRLSPGAVSESIKVLRALDRSVLKNRKNAELWHHRGMVAWALYERSRHQPPAKGLDWTLLVPLADTSLRLAVDYAPDNARYFTSLARFLLSSGVPYRLYGPYGPFGEVLERARAGSDRNAHAEIALDAGRISWLRYENSSCRYPTPLLEGRQRVIRARSFSSTGDPLAFLADAVKDYFGETDYLKAELFFREAYEAAPTNLKAFRQYATLLADQQRWMPLAALARSRINRLPNDGWSWLTLGLATHKVNDALASKRAFDSAFKYLDTADVKRLDRIERVLSNSDNEVYATLDDAARAKTGRFYWRNVDPLWSVDNTEPRLEFLARVTFAELRWTSEDRTLNGVNSDWGAWYVRTGTRPPAWDSLDPKTRSETMMDPCKPKRIAWYVMNDTTIVKGPASQWNSLARVRVDSIPSQLVRFRSGNGLTEVFIATQPPVANIQRASPVTGTVRTDFWLLAAGIDDVARDSTLSSAGLVSFTQRVKPGGYVYRVEASADGSRVAGRGTAGFFAGDDSRTGFTLEGFGMSDVLLASSASQAPSARSWKDVRAVPLVGPVLRKSHVTVVWENYDLGEQSNAASYDIAITLRRDITRGRAGRIAASIVGAFAGAGVKRTNDAVEFTVSRSVPYAPLIVDNVSLSLDNTPAGTYTLSVLVTDRVTGKATGRTQTIVIVEPTPQRR